MANEVYQEHKDKGSRADRGGSRSNVEFTPSKTCAAFMQDNSRMRVIIGPVGSGKSVASCVEIIRRASEQEPGPDGIRKTRWCVVRETVRQLNDTTIKTFCDWFPVGTFGIFHKTTKTYFFKSGDVEAEVMFRGLDDEADVANLTSLELTGAFVNEARDVKANILQVLRGRVGRYPSMRDGGPTWYGVWCDSNPPITGSWFYSMLEDIDPDDGVNPKDNDWSVYKQPSGRSPEAENTENLPEDYYSIEGRSDDYIRVYIDGLYSKSLSGTPVFKYFDPSMHMAKGPLNHVLQESRPIVVGIDAGLTPAAVIGQLDAKGRCLVLDEIAAFDMGAKRFCRTLLKPLLFERFNGASILLVVDPAGTQRAQTDEASVVDIFRQEGFKVIGAKTNKIAPRIQAVDTYLMEHRDGEPAFLVDPRCRRLKAAMMGGYRFHPRLAGIEKDKIHSHIADALQYMCLHISHIGGSVRVQRREISRISALGWT